MAVDDKSVLQPFPFTEVPSEVNYDQQELIKERTGLTDEGIYQARLARQVIAVNPNAWEVFDRKQHGVDFDHYYISRLVPDNERTQNNPWRESRTLIGPEGVFTLRFKPNQGPQDLADISGLVGEMLIQEPKPIDEAWINIRYLTVDRKDGSPMEFSFHHDSNLADLHAGKTGSGLFSWLVKQSEIAKQYF